MDSNNVLLGIIAVFVILIIYRSRAVESSLMTGFWKADARFSQESGLITMIMYLGDPSIMGTRKGYIIAANEFGLILNNPLSISFSGYSLNPFMCEYREYSILIDWLDEDPPEYFPSKQTMYFYPQLGKIILAEDIEIKAILYKDGSLMDGTSTAPKKLITDDANNNDNSDTINECDLDED